MVREVLIAFFVYNILIDSILMNILKLINYNPPGGYSQTYGGGWLEGLRQNINQK